VIGKGKTGYDMIRYVSHEPGKGVTGDLESMVMFAGEGVKNINDIPSAGELIERLWREFENK